MGAPAEETLMPVEITIVNPDGLGKPLGQYSQITRVRGASEYVFIAGQLSTDKTGALVGADDFDAQCVQVFANIGAALASVGGGWRNVVQFTTYLVHSQDVPKFMAYRKREFPRLFPGGAYPPNTLVMVDRLVQEPFLVEVQTVAAL
jgi:enamine deaminase RidA (YjgF/YER057c/UK114 family)